MTITIRITPFDDRYAADFGRLNRAWLEGLGLLEEADAKHLDRPRRSIIDPGGQIFFAMADQRPVGTCAVIPHGKGWFEIAKLAVAPEVRRHGIGRRLVEAAIGYARRTGAERIVLVSSTRLQPALRLYESMGFRHEPLPEKLDYASADVYMALDLH